MLHILSAPSPTNSLKTLVSTEDASHTSQLLKLFDTSDSDTHATAYSRCHSPSNGWQKIVAHRKRVLNDRVDPTAHTPTPIAKPPPRPIARPTRSTQRANATIKLWPTSPVRRPLDTELQIYFFDMQRILHGIIDPAVIDAEGRCLVTHIYDEGDRSYEYGKRLEAVTMALVLGGIHDITMCKSVASVVKRLMLDVPEASYLINDAVEVVFQNCWNDVRLPSITLVFNSSFFSF